MGPSESDVFREHRPGLVQVKGPSLEESVHHEVAMDLRELRRELVELRTQPGSDFRDPLFRHVGLS